MANQNAERPRFTSMGQVASHHEEDKHVPSEADLQLIARNMSEQTQQSQDMDDDVDDNNAFAEFVKKHPEVAIFAVGLLAAFMPEIAKFIQHLRSN